jgi:magnesium-transporting ATPase (P-type)
MQKQPLKKQELKKEEIIGSETVFEKLKSKTPWIFGKSFRKPKLNFPKFRLPRLSLPMPSRAISIITIFIILFVLQTGIAYLLVRKPPALGADRQGNAIFILTDINEAFIVESIVASILILLCSTGFVFLYQASKYVYNRKMAVTILTIGVLTIIITFIALQYIIAVKTGVLKQ